MRKTRRLRRRLRGGAKPKVLGQIPWPPQNGCLDQATSITIEPGSYIDRFGPATGNFVSPVIINPYTYSERSLPYYGIENIEYNTTNAGKMKRKQMYYNNFKLEKIPDDDYHIYRVIKPITNVEKCTIAPAFNYQGRGIQYKLPKSVQDYMFDGSLDEKVDFPIVPRFE
jgi:hypothetical protein